jgi:cyclic beta-1,2-glucan synthetase
VDHALRFGAHGLPLMGSGDWNDGMNHVGVEGKGESVWLGWFLHANLEAWAGLAEARGDRERAGRYRAQLAALQQALEAHGWDGAWYRRAYFDDGTPLGSAQNDECQIDSIAQSWAVLSGAGQPERVEQAYQSAEAHLVDEVAGLIKLLAPPFNQSKPDPGYIQGYVPGIRENGAQYTHAALWFIWGCLARGQGDRAAELLSLINPVNHARTPEQVQRYKVEPYVIAADVYTHPQHHGRGGWTWYTGSAAWMWRLGVEALLGLQLRGGALTFNPCLPKTWPGFTATLRRGGTTYAVSVENPQHVNRGVARVEVDGAVRPDGAVPLRGDGGRYAIRVVMGPQRSE